MTEQEENLPTPEDEIEAREKLINNYNIIKSSGENAKLSGLVDKILDNLENWDTLDLWFKEVKDLYTNIQKFINIIETGNDQVQIQAQIVEKNDIEEPERANKPDPAQIDISSIVSQVSEKFAKEINSLKAKIDFLQVELEDKEKSSYKRNVQKIIPKTDSKLPLPKIRIPVFKKPTKIPELKIIVPSVQKQELQEENETSSYDIKGELEKLKISLDTPEKSQNDDKPRQFTSLEAGDPFYTKVVNEKLPKAPILPPVQLPVEDTDHLEISPSPVEEPFVQNEPIKESVDINEPLPTESGDMNESIPNQSNIEESPLESELSEDFNDVPKVQEQVSTQSKPPESSINEPPKIQGLQIFEKSASKSVEETKITPIVSEEALMTPESPKKPVIVPIVSEEPSTSTGTPRKPIITPIVSEEPSTSTGTPRKPIITPIVSEEPSSSIGTPRKPIFAPIVSEEASRNPPPEKKENVPFFAEMPKIAPIKVEKSEIDSIKSSATNLFDVFSSVGGKTIQEGMNQENYLAESANSYDSLDIIMNKSNKKLNEKNKMRGVVSELKTTLSSLGSEKPNTVETSEFSPINVDQLPMNKDSLYKELITLEGKRYSLEKNFNNLELSYKEGAMNEVEFKNRTNKLTNDLSGISTNIDKIRKLISSL